MSIHGHLKHMEVSDNLASNPSGTASDVSLIEVGGGLFNDEFRAFSTMQIYVIYERNKNAPYPE